MSNNTGKKKIVVVLGMHRSGTSAVSGALSRVGINFGPEDQLMPPDLGINAKGYYEHRELSVLNEQVLAALGSSWDDFRPINAEEFQNPELSGMIEKISKIVERDFAAKNTIFGIKDPRMCKLVPFWEQIFTGLGYEPVYLLVYRHPFPVFKSLERRNAISEAKSNLLWLSYMLAAERCSRGRPRAIISYDALLPNPVEILTAALEKLGLDHSLDEEQVSQLGHFLTPELRHNSALDKDYRHSGLTWLSRAMECFQEMFEKTGEEEPTEELDRVVREFEAALPHFTDLLFLEGGPFEELIKLRIEVSDLIKMLDESTAAQKRLNEAYFSMKAAYENTKDVCDDIKAAYENTRKAYEDTHKSYEQLSNAYEESRSVYEETHRKLVLLQSSIFGKAYRVFYKD